MNKLLRTLALVAMLLGEVTVMGQTDVTSSIVNPSFDGRGFAGWRNKGFQTQTNSDFSGKTYQAYAERWVSANSGGVPDSYLLQTITGLTNGQYRLTVNAQNINQNATSTAQTGAYIVGNGQTTTVTASSTYTVDFAVVDGTAEIGFYTESSTGNWIACDNFQLSRLSTNVSYLRSGLSALVTKAQSLQSSSMQSAASSALSSAITNAQRYTSNGSQSNVESAYATLKAAIHEAENSIFYTKTSTGSGAPTVTTDSRYQVGTDIAFARSTVSGNNIIEQGYCYSTTNATPTVADDRSTRYLDHVGYIHILDNLTPGTMYYIRPYAVNSSYKVGYGDVLRIYTLPRSTQLTYDFNASGDENIDARLKGSMDGIIGYWNHTTSIVGFKPTANYASGTPTADCGYGGWIRFGPSVDYQSTGTAMHECLHGIGVGTDATYSEHMTTYSSGPGSSYGAWLGKRANQLTQFWDNNEGEFITGGGSHVWATNGSNMTSFTINGANEDAHTDLQYYGNGLLAQAMCEDGMCPVAYKSFLPGYCFQHTDNTKYYIRNTNENYGLNTSTYLYATGTTLKWKTYTDDATAAADNAAAWYIEFDPATQYYYFKNVSTGRYLYSSGGSFSVSGTTKDSNSAIHLNLAWWDATFGSGMAAVSKNTYYLMHPADAAHPVSLTATTSGSLTTSNYNSAENNTAARWMILTMDETDAITDAVIETERNKVTDIIAKVRALASTTHTDNTGSANSTLESTLSNIESALSSATPSQCEGYRGDVIAACKTFMQNTTPGASGYNITFLLSDPGFDTGDGWTGSPVLNYSAGEKYQTTFDIYQTLTSMPSGRYQMKMQAYERPGASTDVYTDYKDGGTDTYPVTAQIYIGNAAESIFDISEYAQSAKLGVGTETEVSYNNTTAYIPNNMEAGANYFAKNYYDNSVEVEEFTGGTLQFGIRNATSVNADWTMFDNVRLYYFGGQTDGQDPAATANGYDITGAMAPYLQTGGMTGWTNNGFSANTNAGQEDTNGDAKTTWPFIEKWTWSAGSGYLSDASVYQTITELPNGTYYIGGSFIASQQGDASVNVTGVTFYAGNQSINVATANHVPERYSLRVEVTDGTLTYGLKVESTNANWVAMDNLFLIYDGTEAEYLSHATSTNPVRIPLANPNMDDATSGWTTSGAWSTNYSVRNNFNGRFMEVWTASTGALADNSVMQSVSLPKGNYMLKAAVNAVRQNSSVTVSGVSLFLGENTAACHTGDGAPEVYSIPATLEAGDYEIGLKIESTDANWVAWDNAILYYYGNEEDPYHTALALCQEAAAANEPNIAGAAQAALSQYTWTDAEYATKTTEEISTAITILNNGAAISNASQQANSLITNADFTGGTSNAGVQGSGGQVYYPSGWNFIRSYEGWNDTFVSNGVFNAWAGVIHQAELYQDITGLPNGTYRLTADVRVDNEAANSNTALYGFGSSDIARSDEAGSEIAGGSTEFANYSCTFEVTGNTARIGIRSDYSFYQLKNIALEFVTSTSQAASETDASYLRQEIHYSNAYEFDATIDKYQYASGVKAIPVQKNLIIKGRSGEFANTNNVVVNGTCANLVLTDGYPLQITAATGAFTATTATYTRAAESETAEWGSIVLPFAISANENVSLYKVTKATVLETEEVGRMNLADMANPAANTPLIFRLAEPGTTLSLTAANVAVALTTGNQNDPTEAEGWTLRGTYATEDISAETGYFSLTDSQFSAQTEAFTTAPFRAYAVNGAALSSAYALSTALPGDVNSDGKVDAADVAALVGIVLGKDNGETRLYDHTAADVNSDGQISLADVTALVNLIP